jgi:hypothetical protein
MLRLLGFVSKENRPLLLLSQNLRNIHSNNNTLKEDTFGTSSKFCDSDSGINKVRIPNTKSSISTSNKFLKKKTSFKRNYDSAPLKPQNLPTNENNKLEGENALDDSDTFGTLNNEFKNV